MGLGIFTDRHIREIVGFRYLAARPSASRPATNHRRRLARSPSARRRGDEIGPARAVAASAQSRTFGGARSSSQLPQGRYRRESATMASKPTRRLVTPRKRAARGPPDGGSRSKERVSSAASSSPAHVSIIEPAPWPRPCAKSSGGAQQPAVFSFRDFRPPERPLRSASAPKPGQSITRLVHPRAGPNGFSRDATGKAAAGAGLQAGKQARCVGVRLGVHWTASRQLKILEST